MGRGGDVLHHLAGPRSPRRRSLTPRLRPNSTSRRESWNYWRRSCTEGAAADIGEAKSRQRRRHQASRRRPGAVHSHPAPSPRLFGIVGHTGRRGVANDRTGKRPPRTPRPASPTDIGAARQRHASVQRSAADRKSSALRVSGQPVTRVTPRLVVTSLRVLIVSRATDWQRVVPQIWRLGASSPERPW